ncbi:transient receptor potential cation channel subfamily M member 2-like isoform X2 [Amphiura filiformis]|uniref:transient receptor potential cation channel subfamily M member 2-like isoform X2 n=1 Tax=Amphiura filiformis TaxID=82378 RepID=UPI003B21A4DB
MAEDNQGFKMENLSKNDVTGNGTDHVDDTENTGGSKDDIQDWIQTNFYKKECVRYVPSEKTKDRCECGRTEKEHSRSGHSASSHQDPDSPWDSKVDIERETTDTFGNVTFTNNGNKAKYVRLADDTNPKLILELLRRKWKLDTPELVISVTGGRKNFKLNPEEKRQFQRAIKEVSQSKKTWILTGGTNCGAARCAGKAFVAHHYSPRQFLTRKGSATYIGISPWGYVENTDRLLGPHTGQNEVTYSVDDRPIPRGQPAPLSPNHTHFILVDDGRRKSGGDLQLRLKIEKALVQENIPLVVVVLEGGKDAIDHVCESVQQDVPVILCNTGRAADLLSKLYKGQEPDTEDARMKDLVSQIDIEGIKQICQIYKEFFTDFDMTSDMSNAIKDALTNDDVTNDSQEKEKHLKRWIKRKFKKMEANQNGSTSYDTIRDQSNLPTDAFGEVTFVPSVEKYRNTAKYVRLSVDTDPEPIKELLQKKWNLPDPKLVISVIGGSKNISLKPEDKRNFNEALKKASRTTSTWIFTNGTNCGVTKCVGDAVREGQSLKWMNGKPADTINCIGISPWGYVDATDTLVERQDTDGIRQVEYYHDKPIERRKPVPLNPNHTHFILVDDGRKAFGADLLLRPKLEKSIFADGVPLVLIVLEGGEDAINHVVNSVDQGVSVVLCKNTGRAADLLSHIAAEVKKLKNTESSRDISASDCEDIIQSTCQQCKKEDKGMNQLIDTLNEKEGWHKICKTFAKDDGLVTVFEMGNQQVLDMNLAIMNALLFGQHNDTDKQIYLAISWNRVDIAKNLFVNTTHVRVVEEHMTKVLLQDKADFLQLFIKHNAFDIKDDALAAIPLKNVYQEKQIFEDMRRLVINVLGRKRTVRRSQTNTDENVANLRRDVQKILGFKPDNYACSMSQRSIHQKRALWFLELFLWAVISGRENVAEFCWEQVEDPTIAALAATKILRLMLSFERGLDRLETLRDTISKYESRATGLIDECYRTDKKLARGIVENCHPHWKDKTTIEMADDADSIDFISHPCCTSKLDDDWYGSLVPSLNPWWFIPLALTVFLIPVYNLLKRERFVLNFKPPQPGTPRKRWHRRVFSFLQAPVTKFWIYTISYVVFLLFYTYVLLFRFDKELQWIDFFLFVWIVSMVFEEIRVIIIMCYLMLLGIDLFLKERSEDLKSGPSMSNITCYPLPWGVGAPSILLY